VSIPALRRGLLRQRAARAPSLRPFRLARALPAHSPQESRQGRELASRKVSRVAARQLRERRGLRTSTHRYPREIEEAAYFCSLEAIQNATKHAFDATAVSINLSHASTLDVEVRDNGAGFDSGSVVTGRGLLTMRDRLDAVGGHLTIQSQPGQGTRILASIPLP
jgi:signal transduction histidine kinase